MLKSIIDRGVEDAPGLHVSLNAPELFLRKDFIDYITTQIVFTWHQKGTQPDEYADVIVLFEPCLNGEGSSSDMPEDIWDTLIAALRAKYGDEGERIPPAYRDRHIALRITNLEE